jgi:hypothetical protein
MYWTKLRDFFHYVCISKFNLQSAYHTWNEATNFKFIYLFFTSAWLVWRNITRKYKRLLKSTKKYLYLLFFF